MPGLSFLLKKAWHPQTMENQKKLYIAEQEAIDRSKREEEAALEIAKEREMQQYEKMGDITARDPRTSSLQFMYAQPKKKDEDQMQEIVPSQYLGVGEEDRMVAAFLSKVDERRRPDGERRREKVASPRKQMSDAEVPLQAGDVASRHIAHQRKGGTQAEMAERHPALKNAPLEGAYAKDIAVRHKPFSAPVRDVQCLRCGEWGHQSGDRECPMKDFNPHDWARQKREDPLTFMQHDMLEQKQKLILKHASLPAEMRFGLSAAAGGTNGEALQLVASDDEEDGAGSDPEAEFLATLSSREKHLLLLHLENMEVIGEHISSYSAYEFENIHTGNNSDTDTDSSDSDAKFRREGKKRQRKSDRDSHHKHKKKSRKENKSKHKHKHGPK